MEDMYPMGFLPLPKSENMVNYFKIQHNSLFYSCKCIFRKGERKKKLDDFLFPNKKKMFPNFSKEVPFFCTSFPVNVFLFYYYFFYLLLKEKKISVEFLFSNFVLLPFSFSLVRNY